MNRLYRDLRLCYAEYSLTYWILRHGCIVRQDATPYRRPLCISGQGRVWAVCDLVACEPSTHPRAADGSPLHYAWKLANLTLLTEPIAMPTPGEYSLWQRENGDLEPPMCGAEAQHRLNRMFPVAEVLAPPEIGSTSQCDYCNDAREVPQSSTNYMPCPVCCGEPEESTPVVATSISEAGQLAMF